MFSIAQATSDNSGLDIYHFNSNSPLDLKTSLNNYFSVKGYVSLKDAVGVTPPEHLPVEIEKIFTEGATCCATQCWNAAGTMFRTCIDLATRPLLPTEETQGLNSKTRRDLGLRLPWLFQAGLLPTGLQELSDCVREDGNDGAHQGTLVEEDAEDLLDFTTAILERLYTEPQRIELAKARREERRNRQN